MAERLRFDQAFGDRAAVDGDEWPVAPSDVLVYGLRDQLIARAALSRNQDRQRASSPRLPSQSIHRPL